jgi:tetratricopeptide (TPR) repeat protein
MRADLRRIAIAVFVLCAIAARAQAASDDRAGAKAALAEGDRSFQLGRFDAAIDAYERAFGLDPQPAFLFNIALSHRRQYQIDGKVDHLARARELYRNYLRLEPQSSRRAGVEKLIAELTAKIDEVRGRPEPPPAPGPVAPVAPEPAPANEPPAPPGAPPARTLPPPADHPAALVAAPAGDAGAPRGSSRKWIIGGSIAAAAVVAAVAIFFVTRSDASFDGPGVNLSGPMH